MRLILPLQSRDICILHADGYLLDAPPPRDEAEDTRRALEREPGGLHPRTCRAKAVAAGCMSSLRLVLSLSLRFVASTSILVIHHAYIFCFLFGYCWDVVVIVPYVHCVVEGWAMCSIAAVPVFEGGRADVLLVALSPKVLIFYQYHSLFTSLVSFRSIVCRCNTFNLNTLSV